MGQLNENKTGFDSELEDQIYRCLDKGIKLHVFPDRLEEMYKRYHRRSRVRRFFWFSLMGIIFYNLFLISDKAMLPDVFPRIFKIRLYIITPALILAVMSLLLKDVAKFADILVGTMVSIASASILYFLLISGSPNVNNYHTGLIVMVVVLNIVMRLRFKYAVIFSFLIFIMYTVTINNIALMNNENVSNNTLVMFSVVFFTLIGNYQIANENRMNYLNSLLRRINAAKLKVSNKKLMDISITDSLTGLTNRRHFDVSLENAWKICRRSGEKLSLIFIDIDCFKNYNDNYGHQKGDECLIEVAEKLSETVKRPGDIVARYGGEEFVVLIPSADSKGALELAEEMREAVEKQKIPHEFSEVSDVVTISLGTATLTPSNMNTPLDLLQAADKALYNAKKRNRNMVCQSIIEK